MPWPPVAVIGTAVAFITGFKNNASYGRLWEARQVWGTIVNVSRAFGILVLDFIPDQSARTRILYRHFAWLTALRYQLREPRTWESMHKPSNVEYRRKYKVPEWDGTIQSELAALLDEAELSYILGRKNRAAQLLVLQSEDLRRCAETSLPGEMRAHCGSNRVVPRASRSRHSGAGRPSAVASSISASALRRATADRTSEWVPPFT